MKNEQTVHRWTSKSLYFDIENGEELTKQNATQNYNKVKSHKKTTIEHYHGKIEYWHECQRKNQLKLF